MVSGASLALLEGRADYSNATARSVNYTCDDWKELDLEESIREISSLVIG